MTQEQEIKNLLEKINGKLDRIMAHWGVPPDEIEAKLRGVLPMELQTPSLRYEVLVKAVKKGIIEVKDDGLTWHCQKTTLLAYFCGRLWSGDYVVTDKVTQKRHLMAGKWTFPSKALEATFGVKNLKQYRNGLFIQKITSTYEAVDYLFEG